MKGFSKLGKVASVHPMGSIGVKKKYYDELYGENNWAITGTFSNPQIDEDEQLRILLMDDERDLQEQPKINWKKGEAHLWVKHNPYTCPVLYATQSNGGFNYVKSIVGEQLGKLPLKLPIPEKELVKDSDESGMFYAWFAKELVCRPVVYEEKRLYLFKKNEYANAPLDKLVEVLGVKHFMDLGKRDLVGGLISTLYWNDHNNAPQKASVRIMGALVPELKGRLGPHVSNDIYFCFKPLKTQKTLAEMTSKEFDERGYNNHWKTFENWMADPVRYDEEQMKKRLKMSLDDYSAA